MFNPTQWIASHSIGRLLHCLQSGTLVPAPFARGFDWQPKQVCRLLQSVYQRNPIGAAIVQCIGPENRADWSHTTATEVLIDGKQRLLSMMSALYRLPIITPDLQQIRIRIAFNPQAESDRCFRVADTSTDRSPAWVPDVAALFDPEYDYGVFDIATAYCAQNVGCNVKEVFNKFVDLRNMLSTYFPTYSLCADVSAAHLLDIYAGANQRARSLKPR
jgi:hypothetical protein